MLRGLTTVNYWTNDVEAAKGWYAQLLGIDPYFERPGGGAPAAYVEFRLGDYQHELGLIDARFRPAGHTDGAGGAVVYWAVDDVQAAFDRLLELGATEYEKPVERGPGFVTASVVDPFGNILGVMYNQHYLEMLGSQGRA